MKTMIIGANGQLGWDVCAALEVRGHETIKLTHSDIEIADEASVAAVVARWSPAAIINTAAFHNVELCEKEPAKAFAVNALGARNLSRVSADRGIYFLHVSTDYVFDGSKNAPYVENDNALPLNTYGNSKLAGETYVRTLCPDGAVIRVSGIYGANPCRAKGGMNFVLLMLKLAKERPDIRVVDDEILTPTFTVDIANQVVAMVEARPTGLFHATAQGACSWYEFARAVFDITRKPVNLQKARRGEFPAKVLRPSYSVLENAALKGIDLDLMPSWREGLATFLTLEVL